MDDLTKKYEEREQERLLQKSIEKRKTSRNNAYIISVLVLVVGGLMAYLPSYRVWDQRLSGAAELARAESRSQIRILEARAELEAAKALAEAKVIRAEGVAHSKGLR